MLRGALADSLTLRAKSLGIVIRVYVVADFVEDLARPLLQPQAH